MRESPTAKQVFTNPIHFFAFGFGTGLAPVAPGTFGTLAAIPIYLLMEDLMLPAYCGVLLILCLFSIFIAGRSSQQLGVHDHSGIVIDEIVGFLLTMTLAPQGWGWILAGFLLFRLFDIIKPWPINILDRRVSGGLGIVVDDLMAGIYGGLSLLVIEWLLNQFS
ncbi:MAG: phosphatidylglycerophosphatase A [Pseudomonadota bacterium]